MFDVNPMFDSKEPVIDEERDWDQSKKSYDERIVQIFLLQNKVPNVRVSRRVLARPS